MYKCDCDCYMFQGDVTRLPEPISTQCVVTDGDKYTFIAYQLNTLNLNSMDGIKNLAWVDSDNYMFQRIVPKRAMLRNTRYEDYDPSVFQKFMAMYVNGAKLDSFVEPDADQQQQH